MKTVIIRYNAGNIRSVMLALQRLGVSAVLSDDPDEIHSADKVIFPGVGEASSAMRYLRARRLDEVLRQLRQPVLGICLGMQLLCTHSEENDTDCMGIFPVKVRRFPPVHKVPQIGWNQLTATTSPLFVGLEEEPYVYFVHSYYAEMSPYTIATADYGLPFSAALHRDNFYAAQFHPEKSSQAGERLLSNFLSL